MNVRKSGIWGCGITVILVVIVVGLFFFPSSEDCWRNHIMTARTRSWYELTGSGTDTLYFSGLLPDSCLSGFSLSKEKAWREFMGGAFFLSYSGKLATVADTLVLSDTIMCERWLPALNNEIGRLDIRIHYYREMLDEMAYYERTHSVADEGYHQVMEYHEKLRADLDEMERLYACALKIRDGSGKAACLHRVHEVSCHAGNTTDGFNVYKCRWLAENPDGAAVWQINNGILPCSSVCFRPNPFPYMMIHSRCHLYKIWGRFGLSSFSDTVSSEMFCVRMMDGQPVIPVLETVSGAPVSDEWGCLNGMMVRGKCISSFDLFRMQWSGSSWYVCFWEDMKAWMCRMYRKMEGIYG